MQNTIHSLGDLLKLSAFHIPEYQRAYAWENAQLAAFVDDLREQTQTRRDNPGKDYFLGTVLLHEVEPKKVHIVDGQQRLTTAVIFAACALAQNDVLAGSMVSSASLRHAFVFDQVEQFQRLRTIKEDNPFFASYVLRLQAAATDPESPSSTRIKAAFDYFAGKVNATEWEALLQTLSTAKVMVYAVNSSADATLIFELQNDRGKRLTDLEALKSYLMHLVYLHAVNPDDLLQDIQTHFSHIYRTVEKLADVLTAPDEEALLAYHCAAYLLWRAEEWRKPKDLVKRLVREMPSGTAVADWVVSFSAALRSSFSTVLDALNARDTLTPFAHLTLFGNLASFWPLLIKTFRSDATADKRSFCLACRLMEVFAVCGYGFSIRSDAGQSSFYGYAKEFQGDFDSLFCYLHGARSWYDIPNRFAAALDRPSLYHANKSATRYLLWRYENSLRTVPGQKAQPLAWRDYLRPDSDATSLSLEHIAAQNNPISSTQVAWEEGQPLEDFAAVATHRLGNLVIDFKSGNSAKGKGDFTDKLESLEERSTFLSQGELKEWASGKETPPLVWDVASIRARHRHLTEFVLRTWNPSTYFTPPAAASAPVTPDDAG
ncbi:MAG: DUF262 domain-containing protein [Opitutaceae bacterium]|nr:DUF262 domain-containing protein [Opitutaceae bacterium]